MRNNIITLSGIGVGIVLFASICVSVVRPALALVDASSSPSADVGSTTVSTLASDAIMIDSASTTDEVPQQLPKRARLSSRQLPLPPLHLRPLASQRSTLWAPSTPTISPMAPPSRRIPVIPRSIPISTSRMLQSRRTPVSHGIIRRATTCTTQQVAILMSATTRCSPTGATSRTHHHL
jgi:hypothetical protein